MVRGFSRFVLFLFLGLLRAPTRNSPERVRDTIWTFPKKVGNTRVWKPPGLASLNRCIQLAGLFGFETSPLLTQSPKIEKFQDFAPGLKLSSDQSQIEISIEIESFKRATQQGPFLWGIFKVGIEIFNRDWNCQAYRLKISSVLIEIFKRIDWKLHAINRDWIFQSLGPQGRLASQIYDMSSCMTTLIPVKSC